MKQIFSTNFMIDNRGCYSLEELKACSFMKNGSITLKSVLTSEISLKDKYWFVCKKLATKEENQQIAIKVAEIVLPIYEKRYPEDKRPREAIEAAKSFITGHISLEELKKKRSAADAAYAADADAYAAAYAADAADAAADAAAYAADAAAYAADAAYAAAYADAYAAATAAAYAAAAADIKKQLEAYLLTFIIE